MEGGRILRITTSLISRPFSTSRSSEVVRRGAKGRACWNVVGALFSTNSVTLLLLFPCWVSLFRVCRDTVSR